MPIVGQFGSLAGLGSLILPGGAMESIATVTVGSGGASSITFSDIPGTYQHLQLRLITPFNAQDGTIQMTINGASTNYRQHRLYGSGAAAGADSASYSIIEVCYDWNIARNSNHLKTVVMDIVDYASTTKNKTLRWLGGVENNGSGRIEMMSAGWFSTNAITSLSFQNYGNDGSYGYKNFLQHTSFALYGLRAP